MYTWEEELTEEDSKLFEDERYIGRVLPVGGSWRVEFQPEPDELPPHPHGTIALCPDKASAQSTLIRYWEVRKSPAPKSRSARDEPKV